MLTPRWAFLLTKEGFDKLTGIIIGWGVLNVDNFAREVTHE